MSKKKQGSENKLQLRDRRYFSEEFKRQKVKELCAKQTTVTQLCRLYEVSPTSVYKWLHKYSPHHSEKVTTLVVQMESEAQKTAYLQSRLADMERIVGQKQLELDYLNKLLEISSQELGFDLKKNFATKLSSGSVYTVNPLGDLPKNTTTP